MKFRAFSLFAVLIGAYALVGDPSTRPLTADRADEPYGPDVIHLDGLGDIAFGDTTQELTRRGELRQTTEHPSCGTQLADTETASPVFAGDRLVLLWADAPLRTPEGVTTGSSVHQVRAAYPGATVLAAPRGTFRFGGLLARRGDRAYLFLHDGRIVRKTIAGYADYAQRLFDEGFGLC